MTSSETHLQQHLQQILKIEAEKPLVVIYKGFPVPFLKEVQSHIPHLSDLSFLDVNDKISLSTIEQNFWSIGVKLNSISSERRFIIYEEFLLLPSHALKQIPVQFLLVVNNFYDFYPNQTTEAFEDIEDSINNDITVAANPLFEKFYADSRIIAGISCIQYLDYAADLNTVGVNVLKYFDLKAMPEPEFEKGNAPRKNVVQFLASDASYLALKYSLFFGNVPAKVDLLVDRNIQHIDSDSDELKILTYLLKNNRCKLSLYEKRKKFENTWRPELDELLRLHWGSEASFKNLLLYQDPDKSKKVEAISQGAIIDHIVQQYENANADHLFEDVFLTAPTGAGKSLLFQLPAIYLTKSESEGPVTIVISPLKALMADQVIALKENRNFNEVAFLNSDLSLIERQNIIDQVVAGRISLLYMSPELLLSYDIRTFIGERELGLLVVDEAHLVTTWGRDFRVDYWFLGNYIKRLRRGQLRRGHEVKGKNAVGIKTYRFPVVALTATAVYNGIDDMVFDTIGSLNMQNCRIYIGRIKREEITFKYYKFDTKDHTLDKLNRTISRIDEFVTSGKKSIFYFPWISQIENLRPQLKSNIKSFVTSYHADLHSEERSNTLRTFKTGSSKCVLATKAFGMGVDISDIEVVYHHAPSGALSDYVQEIGRLARKPNLKGKAVMDFNPKDLKFTKILFGLSSLKQFQVSLVLRKINSLFGIKQNRNILVSIEDFQYIFTKDANPEQKVKSALLVIEKDLLAKFGYNVLIVRPKSLFSTVFGSIKNEDFNDLKEHYGEFIEVIEKPKYISSHVAMKGGGTLLRKNSSAKTYVRIFLDRLWETHFPEDSFPSIKHKYFEKGLLPGVEPMLKVEIHFKETIEVTRGKFEQSIKTLEDALASFGGKFFKKEALLKKLNEKFDNPTVCRKLTDLVTVFYSDKSNFGLGGSNFNFYNNNFLQEKTVGFDVQYRVVNTAFNKVKSQMIRRFQIQFEGMDETLKRYVGFVPATSTKNREKIKLVYLLEIFDLSTYEITGGELPQMFIRLNDPQKINSICRRSYTNAIVADVERRHKLAVEIMTHFFQTKMSDEARWDYIEDYFLGREVQYESAFTTDGVLED